MACHGCFALSREVEVLRREVARLAGLSPGEGGKLPPVARPEERRKTSFAKSDSVSASPGTPRGNAWRVVESSSRGLRIRRGPRPLPLSNRFGVLKEAEAGVTGDSVLFVGDSMIRDQAIILRRTTGRRAEGFCFAGAGISKISQTLKASEKFPCKTTVVEVGTNDVGTSTSESIRAAYRDLLVTLKERRCPAVMVGILPRMSAGALWSSRAIGVNNWLSSQCSSLGIPFVDLWDVFVRRPNWYKRDGVHLNVMGKEYVCRVLDKLLAERSVLGGFLG